MSLFFGNLALAEATHLIDEVKIAVLAGSGLAGIIGAFVPSASCRAANMPQPKP